MSTLSFPISGTYGDFALPATSNSNPSAIPSMSSVYSVLPLLVCSFVTFDSCPFSAKPSVNCTVNTNSVSSGSWSQALILDYVQIAGNKPATLIRMRREIERGWEKVFPL